MGFVERLRIKYIIVQIIGAFFTTIIAIMFLRKNINNRDNKKPILQRRDERNKQSRGFLHILISRNKEILFRVLIITVPLYIFIYFLNYNGFFRYISNNLPNGLGRFMLPESVVIVGLHFSGILSAASAASLTIKEGILTENQVLVTLLCGYVITLPVRAVRHVLPLYLGIFPGKTGLYIIAISQSIRIVIAIIAIFIVIKFGSV